jgi:hypothetical protein
MEKTTTSCKKSPEQVLIDSYIEQLSEQEKLVLDIAINHLETSFDVVRSIGYKEWLKNKD